MTNKFYFAPPREGKTYVVVAEAIEYLKKGKSVLSNFPIVTPDGYVSQVWEPGYIYENIQNCLVIIDESQRDFDSQTHKSLDDSEDAFFAASGHNGVEIRIISQNLTRVTKAVRDRCNEFIFVQKGKILNIFRRDREGKLGLPFYFTATSYLTLEDLESHNEERIYTKSRVRYTEYIGKSYDTHYFKKKGSIFKPVVWTDNIVRYVGNIDHVIAIWEEPESIFGRFERMITRFQTRKSLKLWLMQEW